MRDNGIRKAGISRWRYRELRAFCRQYDEKRAQASRLLSAYPRTPDGRIREMAAGEKTVPEVARREKLLGDCGLIERTAKEADPGGSEAIIKNAARGIRYEETGYYGERTTFYRAREQFFIGLDKGLRERGEQAG